MADLMVMITVVLVVATLILIYLWLNTLKELHLIKDDLLRAKHDTRSLYVKHGKAWENFVPFMPGFDKIADKDNTVFLGMPIDLISFDDDAIKFIEIKTGNAQLNANQRRIKKLVKDKKVKWFELHYKQDSSYKKE